MSLSCLTKTKTKTRQDKDKTRQVKTRQDKTRQRQDKDKNPSIDTAASLMPLSSPSPIWVRVRGVRAVWDRDCRGWGGVAKTRARANAKDNGKGARLEVG